MNPMVPVRFYEDTLWAVDVDGSVLVSLRPVCVSLSLDWSSQRKRVLRDAILSKGMVIMTIPSPGGVQETACLPLDLLPGWLFGIDDRRIADPAIREKVLAYKRECYGVLYDHFMQPKVDAPAPEPAEPFGLDPDFSRVNTHIQLVRLCERLKGRAAANRLWAKLGLPDPGEDEASRRLSAPAGTTQGEERADIVLRFLADCTVTDPRGAVRAETMRRAYFRWAAENEAPDLTPVALGIALARAGIAKRKAPCTQNRTQIYTGLRLVEGALHEAGGALPRTKGALQ